MQHDDVYESWRQARARIDVPAGFADAVMARLPALAGAEQPPLGWRGRVIAVLNYRPVRLGLCTLAAAVCLFRMAAVLGIFLID